MRTLLTRSGPEGGPPVTQAGVCSGGPGGTGIISLYSPPVTLETRPSELTRAWTGLETMRELCDMLNSLVRKVRMQQAAPPRWWLRLCAEETHPRLHFGVPQGGTAFLRILQLHEK